MRLLPLLLAAAVAGCSRTALDLDGAPTCATDPSCTASQPDSGILSDAAGRQGQPGDSSADQMSAQGTTRFPYYVFDAQYSVGMRL